MLDHFRRAGLVAMKAKSTAALSIILRLVISGNFAMSVAAVLPVQRS